MRQLVELFTSLVELGKAELRLGRYIKNSFFTALALLGIAILFLISAMYSILGAIYLSLKDFIGPSLALANIGLVSLTLAAIFFWIGRRIIRRL